MAPVAYVYHQTGIWGSVMAQLKSSAIIRRFGKKQFMTQQDVGKLLNKLGPELCKLLPGTTNNFLEWVCGPGSNIDTSRTSEFVRYTPAGTSVKNMVHWEQGLEENSFRMYDYGSPEANAKRHGTTKPPLYNLSDMVVPTALFTGDSDYFCHPVDVERLRKELPKGVEVKFHVFDKFSHLDFTWGVTSHEIVYRKILKILGRFHSSEWIGSAMTLEDGNDGTTTLSFQRKLESARNPRKYHSCWSCLPKLCGFS